jgi:regulator of sigma E protease
LDFIGFLPSFGNFLWTALAFVVALSVIVAIHEYGHYIVGRWSGIHAEVFSLGFGPRLWSRMDKRGTRWQIAALPFGGYVKFLGDVNAASAGADDATMARLSPEERRHTMHGAPLWARAATVAAGPVFNFILSILVFAALFWSQGTATETPTVGQLKSLPGGAAQIESGDEILGVAGQPAKDFESLLALVDKQVSSPSVDYLIRRGGTKMTVTGPVLYPARAESVTPGSAAYDAGLKKGDVVTAADGVELNTFSDLQKAVADAAGKPLTLSVWHPDGTTSQMKLAPRVTDVPKADGGFETKYLIGLTGEFFFVPATEPTTPVEAVTGAARQTWFIAKSSLSGMANILTGAISTCNLRGPLGIAETSGAAASNGVYDFIWFIAVLSTAVGLLNLFPIPMLDGGHLVFHAWEWVTGRPPSDRILNVAMSVGLALVLGLMVFGLTNDVFCP